jgi:hypothetical protein
MSNHPVLSFGIDRFAPIPNDNSGGEEKGVGDADGRESR